MSMDASTGKIVWAKHTEIQQVNLKQLSSDQELKDGEKVPLNVKDMGSCEIYPQTLSHSPNGRYDPLFNMNESDRLEHDLDLLLCAEMENTSFTRQSLCVTRAMAMPWNSFGHKIHRNMLCEMEI